ncbi:polyketide synthase [Azospirillum argentinense]
MSQAGLGRGAVEPVAVVGMSGVFPGADGIAALRDLLEQGRRVAPERPADRPSEGGSATAPPVCCIPGVGRFDAAFFGIAPIDAEQMDPQQRLFLEQAWSAVEDAGQRPGGLAGGRLGVFVGAQYGDYARLLAAAGELRAQGATGNALAMIANRVSYLLGVHGPSETVSSGEASSLVALHRAVAAIRSGQCDAALCGGVNVLLRPETAVRMLEPGDASPSGQCRVLDAAADGRVAGEGCGVLFLKPLGAALADRNPVHALIRGVGVGHRGGGAQWDASAIEALADLLLHAHTAAGTALRSLGLLETSGSATLAGDAAEVAALHRAFTPQTAGVAPTEPDCTLGSVKAAIGDAGPAAGIAAIIKAVLALREGRRYGVPGLDRPNPGLARDGGPFVVHRDSRPWPRPAGGPRRAGVTAVSAAGTMAHAILEEWTGPVAGDGVPGGSVPPRTRPVLLSAGSEAGLDAVAAALRGWLLRQGDAGGDRLLRDIAHTLRTGRTDRPFRLALLASSLGELAVLLDAVPARSADPRILRGHAAAGSSGPSGSGPEELARAWVAGAAVAWPVPEEDGAARRLSLPVPPFAGRSHWYRKVEPSAAPSPAAPSPAAPLHAAPPPAADWAERARRWRGETVALESGGEGVALVVLKDARNRNMFTEDLSLGILAAFQAIAEDPSVRVAVITGEGPAFAMGGSPQALSDIVEGRMSYTDFPFLYECLLRCPLPVIAAMQGNASGAGFVFGLYADIVVLAEEATYAANFMTFGLTPGFGATMLLPEKLGRGLAAEMMLTGGAYSGAALRERGVPFPVVPRARVLDHALSTARGLAALPAGSLRLMKSSLAGDLLNRLPAAVDAELSVQRKTYAFPEVRERVSRLVTRLS